MNKQLITSAGASLAVASMLAFTGTSAMAASSAGITFTSFGYTATAGTLSWVGTDSYQTLYAEAAESGGVAGFDSATQSANAFTAQTVSAATASNHSSGSTSSAQTFALSASSVPHYVNPTAYANGAMATGSQSGSFSLSAAGSVTFNIAYSMSLSAVGGNPIDYFSHAVATLTAGNYVSGSSDMTTLENFTFDLAGNTGLYTGTLSLTVAMGAGDIGFYNLGARVDAMAPTATAVPEPAEWALLLAGLATVGAWTRRRRIG